MANSQGLGHDYFPEINRLNPYLIAYEETSRNDTRDLVITLADIQPNSRIRNEIFRVKCYEDSYVDIIGREIEGSQGVCSHFNWRPVLDEFGNYWFTFINNETNKIGLGFINSNMSCLDSSECSIIYLNIDTESEISRPKWSPDGRLIMYNDGYKIKLIDNLYNVIISRNKEKLVLINDEIGEGFFPEWSPNGKYIAFEKEVGSTARLESTSKTEISEILILDYLAFVDGRRVEFNLKDIEERNPDFVVNNRFKPSWTKDSKYLTYLTQVKIGQEQEDVTWFSIAVQIVEEEDRVRAIRFHRSFLSQISNFYRNSEWRTGLPTISLNYRNQSERPFAVNVNEAIGQNRDLFSLIHIMSRIEAPLYSNLQISSSLSNIPTSNSNVIQLDAFAFDNKIRFAYSEQVRDRYSLSYTDIEFTGNTIFGPKLYRPQEVSRNAILYRAILFPGLAQYYKGEYEKALVYGGLGGILVLYGLNHAWNNKRAMINFDFSTPFSFALVTGLALHGYSIYDALQGLPVIRGYNPNIGNINLSVDAIKNPRHNLIFPGVRLNIWN